MKIAPPLPASPSISPPLIIPDVEFEVNSPDDGNFESRTPHQTAPPSPTLPASVLALFDVNTGVDENVSDSVLPVTYKAPPLSSASFDVKAAPPVKFKVPPDA